MKNKIFKLILLTISYMLFLSGTVLYVGSDWFLKKFNGISVSEMVFHLKVPLRGTGESMMWDAFTGIAKPALYYSVLYVFCLLFLYFIINKFILKTGASPGRLVCVLNISVSTAVLFSGLCYAWSNMEIGEYLKSQRQSSNWIEENYVDAAKVNLFFPEKRRNLIYIFMESMESSYLSLDKGGLQKDSLILNLEKKAEDNVSFSRGGV